MPSISLRTIPESLKLRVWSKSLINRYCLNGAPRSGDNGVDTLVSPFSIASTEYRRGDLEASADGAKRQRLFDAGAYKRVAANTELLWKEADRSCKLKHVPAGYNDGRGGVVSHATLVHP